MDQGQRVIQSAVEAGEESGTGQKFISARGCDFGTNNHGYGAGLLLCGRRQRVPRMDCFGEIVAQSDKDARQ